MFAGVHVAGDWSEVGRSGAEIQADGATVGF